MTGGTSCANTIFAIKSALASCRKRQLTPVLERTAAVDSLGLLERSSSSSKRTSMGLPRLRDYESAG